MLANGLTHTRRNIRAWVAVEVSAAAFRMRYILGGHAHADLDAWLKTTRGREHLDIRRLEGCTVSV